MFFLFISEFMTMSVVSERQISILHNLIDNNFYIKSLLLLLLSKTLNVWSLLFSLKLKGLREVTHRFQRPIKQNVRGGGKIGGIAAV